MVSPATVRPSVNCSVPTRGAAFGAPNTSGLSPNGFVASPVAAKAGHPQDEAVSEDVPDPADKTGQHLAAGQPGKLGGPVIRAVFPVGELHSVEQDKGKAGRFEFSRQGGHIPVGVRRTGIHPWNAALARIGVVPDRGRGPLDADFHICQRIGRDLILEGVQPGDRLKPLFAQMAAAARRVSIGSTWSAARRLA